jgi:hypothetical protein
MNIVILLPRLNSVQNPIPVFPCQNISQIATQDSTDEVWLYKWSFAVSFDPECCSVRVKRVAYMYYLSI